MSNDSVQNRTLPLLPDEVIDTADDRENAPPERDPELVARVKVIRGKYAHTAMGVGSEGMHREQQRDKAKEEAQIHEFQP